MRTHPYRVGDLVKARPWLRAPRDPRHARQFLWPFFFPARITDLIGDDGVVLEFCEYLPQGDFSPVITPWPKAAGYSVGDLHEIDCTCTGCESSEDLIDPRARIAQLTGDLQGSGERRAERTRRVLRDNGFDGGLLLLDAARLRQGDFLLFPHQHLHTVDEVRGDIQVRTCTGRIVLGRRELQLVFRPDRPAPVCDAASPHHDQHLAPPNEPGSRSALETAAHVALADLGLLAPTGQGAYEPSR